MLQRAASNAYSWWWASNIRTKQSKWLDNNLQEMEEKVKNMVKLIDADGDSFARKAELYFRRRPELINFVEDAYRSYKALADRFDRISGELHKANHTIATAFPDQVQFALDDDDDDDDGCIPSAITAIDTSQTRKPPNFPQAGTRGKNKDECPTLRRKHHRRISSHLSKEKAQEDIDRLQKEILVLQTEKEFVKSSYQSGQAKFRNIEMKIAEMQEEVCSLQDFFSADAVIEDDEARALMAATAIKSCEDSLLSLHEQQKITNEDARVESQKIRDAEEKLFNFKVECGQSPKSLQNSETGSTMSAEEDDSDLKRERLELQSMCQKVKQHFEMSSETSVVELAEKIDGLVDKVINLELTVASQTSLIRRLTTDTDELQKHLLSLKEDKAALIGDSNALSERLKRADDQLQKIQQLEKCVQNDKNNLRSSLKEACHTFNDLSETLQSPKIQDPVAPETSIDEEAKATTGGNAVCEDAYDQLQEIAKDLKMDCEEVMVAAADTEAACIFSNNQLQEQVEELADAPELQDLLLNGLEGKEKILLSEYSTMLHNYKETKERLSELEKKNQDYHTESVEQATDLKIANAMKDEEIRILRQILSSLQVNPNPNAQSNKEKSKPNAAAAVPREIEPPSAIKEKFRADIDTLLEENLDFWLRFSTSYHQIQKFQTTFKDLQWEIAELQKMKSLEVGSSDPIASKHAFKHELAPIEKRLRGLNTELQVWLENNALLKGELKCRFSSLCRIYDEISRVSKASDSKHTQFNHYQAAKFQGEVRNMQLENNKVAKELQTGLDHARGLQGEIAKALSKLRESLHLSTFKPQQNSSTHSNHIKHLSTKTRIPLRTLLFGSKTKKPSLLACVNPAMHKHIGDLRSAGMPTKKPLV